MNIRNNRLFGIIGDLLFKLGLLLFMASMASSMMSLRKDVSTLTDDRGELINSLALLESSNQSIKQNIDQVLLECIKK